MTFETDPTVKTHPTRIRAPPPPRRPSMSALSTLTSLADRLRAHPPERDEATEALAQCNELPVLGARVARLVAVGRVGAELAGEAGERGEGGHRWARALSRFQEKQF